MAENSKRSALEQIGAHEYEIDEIRNSFQKDIYEYDSSNEEAYSKEGQRHGKGHATVKGHLHSIPDHSIWETSGGHPGYDYRNFATNPNEIGGAYDKWGRVPGSGEIGDGQNSGRNFLFNINMYDPDRAYGKNSVNTDDHVLNYGQYRVNASDSLNVILK